MLKSKRRLAAVGTQLVAPSFLYDFGGTFGATILRARPNIWHMASEEVGGDMLSKDFSRVADTLVLA